MSVGLHEASVPVFLRYLDRLLALVNAADDHARSRGCEEAALLHARLAPDMLPFETQVQIAANFALRGCFPLAGQAIPPYGEFPATFDGLRSGIARVAALLTALGPAAFQGGESRIIESKAGNAAVSLAAPEFLFQYALPNFFFHVTAAYAILRSRGLAIGKEQFDGFHSYPQPAPNLSTVEIKAFVPARDLELSKEFYQALGFTLAFSSDELAYFHRGNCGFLLQKFYVEEHAKNFMMHLLVENVDHWHQYIEAQGVRERFGVKVEAPEDRPWAMRDFIMFDPSGVLWRIAQNIDRKPIESLASSGPTE